MNKKKSVPHREKLPVPERQLNLQITILFIFVALGFTFPEPDFPPRSKGEGTKEVGDDLTASEYLFFRVLKGERESKCQSQQAAGRRQADVLRCSFHVDVNNFHVQFYPEGSFSKDGKYFIHPCNSHLQVLLKTKVIGEV